MAADFAELVESIDSDAIDDIDVVSTARRPLLAYGAIVLDEIIRRAKPRAATPGATAAARSRALT